MIADLLLRDTERNDPVPYAATLTWHKTDPYAVELVLEMHDLTTRRFTFARDLLIDGINEPVGEDGFLQVGPHIVDGYVTFVLPFDGGREFCAERAPVDTFLDRMCRAVPSIGAHAQAVEDLDRWLAEVIA